MRKVAVILVCLVLVVSGMCALADTGAGGKTRPVEEFRELLSGGTGDDPVILDKGDSAPAAIVLHGSGYVAKGHKIKLKATVTPESPEQEIVWRSSDEEIATVSLISSTFRGATNDDVSLFYYNGHGASDGKLLCINDSCLPLDKLSHALQAVPGKVIVILDSCYAGIAIIDGDQADRGDYAFYPFQPFRKCCRKHKIPRRKIARDFGLLLIRMF